MSASSFSDYVDQIEASMNELFVLADDTRPAISGLSLRDGSAIHDLLGRFYSTFPCSADRRGVASLWGAMYMSRFIETAVGASLLLNKNLPLSIEQVGFIVGGDGCSVVAMRMPHESAASAKCDVFGRLHTFVRFNLDPLIAHVSYWANMSPRVLWGTAGDYFYWRLKDIGSLQGVRIDQLNDWNRILALQLWPDGWRNPLFEPYRWVDCPEGERLQRRVCCLFYLLPQHNGCPSFCGQCPVRDRQRIPSIQHTDSVTVATHGSS